jgi:hypothetical protein
MRQPQPTILAPWYNLAFDIDINNLKRWFIPDMHFIYVALVILFPLLEM